MLKPGTCRRYIIDVTKIQWTCFVRSTSLWFRNYINVWSIKIIWTKIRSGFHCRNRRCVFKLSPHTPFIINVNLKHICSFKPQTLFRQHQEHPNIHTATVLFTIHLYCYSPLPRPYSFCSLRQWNTERIFEYFEGTRSTYCHALLYKGSCMLHIVSMNFGDPWTPGTSGQSSEIF